MTSSGLRVRTATSFDGDARRAAEAVFEQVRQDDASFVLFYCDPRYDLSRLGECIRRIVGDSIPVVGCTTAGEITPEGYVEGSLTAMSIASETFNVVTKRIDDLGNFELARGERAIHDLFYDMAIRGLEPRAGNTFGFLLVDGLSLKEESVVSSLSKQLRGIPLFGGSAADGVEFGRTFVYHEGAFRRDCAVVTLVQTDHPFTVFKTQHFVGDLEKMVVTAADPARRVVTEVNGAPAAEEYARVVGLELDDLTPMTFAEYPVIVRVGGAVYVRSIQRVNPDGSLAFFCAIDEGIVLTVARGLDIIDNLQDTFDNVRATVGEPELVLGCDCVLRKLELERKGLKQRAAEIFLNNRAFGFSTYGEQFNAMHVNQTFTGVAIGHKAHD